MRGALRGQAHRQPVSHEQDQGGCDVDGEEGRRDPSEVLPLAAAEQVLMPWTGHRKGGQVSVPSPPSARPALAESRPLPASPLLHLPTAREDSPHLFHRAVGSRAQRGQAACSRSHRQGGGGSCFPLLLARLFHLLPLPAPRDQQGQGVFPSHYHL